MASVLFEDNQRAAAVLGPGMAHLILLEKHYEVEILGRGGRFEIIGENPLDVDASRAVLERLYEQSEERLDLDENDLRDAIRYEDRPRSARAENGETEGGRRRILLRKKTVQARSPGQEIFVEALQSQTLVFGIGPAGTGKTYLAVAQAVSMLMNGEVERIVLSRPAVEAGERLGFLPGDMKEKVDPYLRPIYDALQDMMTSSQMQKRIEEGIIEIAPLAFMRGRTLSNAFIILDEAQNTTPMQMKMFLTRLGPSSRMVVNGDLTQVDLPSGQLSGLRDAKRKLNKTEGVAFVGFDDRDVVRHELVAEIVRAYSTGEQN